jgi:hypothetical protein
MLPDVQTIARQARDWLIPAEDVFLVDLNLSGVAVEHDYSRTRFALKMAQMDMFKQARKLHSYDYYLAVPVRKDSLYRVKHGELFLGDAVLGRTFGLTEDFCDQNYPRRNGTVLNLNPNCRTSCHGCQFCYTGYQTPRDRKKILTRDDLRDFLNSYIAASGFTDLSHLIQIAVVTGCFEAERNVVNFVHLLREVSGDLGFKGEIFYVGSQVSTLAALRALAEAAPFALCLSLECFTNREKLLRDKKRNLRLEAVTQIMDTAAALSIRVNFSYVLGLDPLDVLDRYFRIFHNHVSSFPIINLLQLHSHHPELLRAEEAREFSYYMKARKIIENIFKPTLFRPRAWENYRSPWYLEFADETLDDIRTPKPNLIEQGFGA